MRPFIEELQSLEEGAKGKVLIVATMVIMIFVVYAWFGFFNNMVAGTESNSTTSAATADSQPEQQQSQIQAQPQNPTGNSFGQTMANGIADIGNGFATMISWFENIFKGSGQYNINQ